MKQRFFLLFVALVFSFAVANQTNACTNFLITKGATADSSTMISYAADSHSLYGELYFMPAADYPEGAMLDVYEWDTGKFLGKIKQVRHTYQVVGNMNEWQVSIGETTYTGREELADTTAIMDYGSLIYITLQRAKTAREAIKIMNQLVTDYGYCSTGESFSISDPNEVWIMDFIGKGQDFMPEQGKSKKKPTMYESKGAVWVALRVPDGFISGHANQARIRTINLKDTLNCLYAKDVITFARMKGYFNGKDEEFAFADAYAPLAYSTIRFCDARVWAGFRKVNKDMDQYLPYIMKGDLTKRMPLWIKPDKKLTVADMMSMMRDHYEGTPMDMTTDVGAGPYDCPYRWRPMEFDYVNGKDTGVYFHERAISTQQTGFSFVAQSRSWLPRQVGGINWFGVDDMYSTVYVPMYCGINAVPETYKQNNGSMTEFTWNSAFWVFTWVSNFAYLRYSDMIVDIQKVQKDLEGEFIANTKIVDAKAKELLAKNEKEGIEYLTKYSVEQGNRTVATWRRLGEFLLMKYMDGNVKHEKPNVKTTDFVEGKTKDNPFQLNGTEHPLLKHPKHPRYNDDWYKAIFKDTGDRYKMLYLPGEKH